MTNAIQHAEKAYWVVVADESSATVYSRATRSGDLQQRITLENDAGRKKAGDLVSDKGGRSFDSVGRGRHTMAREKTGPKKHAAMLFASEIAEHIGDVVRGGICRGYVLIAPPRFLGILRDAVTRNCNVQPDATIDKELVGRSIADLQNYIDNAP